MSQEVEGFNFYSLIVRLIVTEEKASFPEIVSYIEREIGAKVDQNALFIATSKLVKMKVLKLNEDITGTFSLQNWKE
jgi:hypothetical protein